MRKISSLQNGLSNIAVDAESGTTQATIPLVFSSTSAPTIEFVANPNGNGAQSNVRVLGVNQNPISINVSSSAAATPSESTATGTPSQPPSTSGESSTSNSAETPSGENASNNGYVWVSFRFENFDFEFFPIFL